MARPPHPAPGDARRPRLWLRLALWLAVPVIAFPMAASALLQPWINRQLDIQLAETARLMLPLIELRLEGAPTEGLMLPNPGSGEYIAWVVRDATGTIRLKSTDVDEAVFATPAKLGRSHDYSNRILAVQTADGRWTLELADPFGRRKEAADAAFKTVLVPASLYGAAVVIAVFAAFRRWR